MMDEDIESPNAWEDEEVVDKGAKSAMKRQNRCFFCALFSVCVLGVAIFLVATNYSSGVEVPLDPNEAQDGIVGDHAKNAKIQEVLENSKNGAIPKHGGKQPWDVPGFVHNNKPGNAIDKNSLMDLRKNHTMIKQQAILDRWNRSHPGEPLPARYNFTGRPTGATHDWGLDNLGGRSPGGVKRPNKPILPVKHPTKTTPDHADPSAGDDEDGHHGLDPHDEPADPTPEEESATKPLPVTKPETPPEKPPVKKPETPPEAPSDNKPETVAKPVPATKPNPPPEEKTEAPPEAPPDNKPETVTKPLPVTKPNPPPEEKTETPPEAPPDNKPETVAKPLPVTKPPPEETPPEAAPDNEPVTKPLPVTKPNPPPEKKTETPPEAPPEKKPETQTPPETSAQVKPEIPPDDVPDAREEAQPQTVEQKETIAEKVLENEEEKETVDETTDVSAAVATHEDIEAWHAGHVDMESGVKFEIVEQMFHDRKAFTQGLTYANGVLYESAGLYHQSTVRILDPATAKVKQSIPMDPAYFAEGMTYYDGKLVQIIWKKAIGFVYDANDIAKDPVQFTYQTIKNNEGWGITYDEDRHEFIITDGSANLMFWDPDCWKTGHCEEKADKPSVPVHRLDGSPAKELNEIEYWRGRVLANVWYSDVLLVINPETGKVEKEYDFASIFPRDSRPYDADVFNGISISEHPDILYVTGKKWDRMFKVKLLV